MESSLKPFIMVLMSNFSLVALCGHICSVFTVVFLTELSFTLNLACFTTVLPPLVLIMIFTAGADPGRGESGSSHGQIFSNLEYFALTFLKILD